MRLSETCFNYIPNVSILKALYPVAKEAEQYDVKARWDKTEVTLVFDFPPIEGQEQRPQVIVKTEVQIEEVKMLELSVSFMPNVSVEKLEQALIALRVLHGRINRS